MISVIACALATSAIICVGLMRTIDGVGFSPGAATSKVTALDVPPPGPGLKTVTPAGPGCAMSARPICAVNCVLLTKAVGRLLPFHLTCEPAMKFDPLMVSVNAGPPAGAEEGMSVAIEGTGFWPDAVILNGSAFDVPPPGVGLTTVRLAEPEAAISAALIWAVS